MISAAEVAPALAPVAEATPVLAPAAMSAAEVILVPAAKRCNKKYLNGTGQKIMTTGCSMGASHAVNFMLRRPDIFDGCIAMSGVYESDDFFGSYMDELLYQNSPNHYMPNLPKDHYYVDCYNHSNIIICVGQGAWEDLMIASTRRLEATFREKGIHAWIDYWGYDVNHDWPWWKVQLPYFMKHILGEP